MSTETDTVEHAAKRLIRFVRVDDHAGGGLLSRDTIEATDFLERLMARDKRRKELAQNGPEPAAS